MKSEKSIARQSIWIFHFSFLIIHYSFKVVLPLVPGHAPVLYGVVGAVVIAGEAGEARAVVAPCWAVAVTGCDVARRA